MDQDVTSKNTPCVLPPMPLLSAVFSVLATTILELQSAALEKEKSMQK
jgi:hypothetical protein